jgi:hypothetical protein
MKLRLKRRPAQRLKRLELLTIPKAKNVPQSFGPVGTKTPQKAGRNILIPGDPFTGGFPPR